MDNSSFFIIFTLTEPKAAKSDKHIYFALSLILYLLIIILNLILIVTILLEKSLHEPMYIFLCNLCINGLFGTAGFYPKFLSNLFCDMYVISYVGCSLQAFVIYCSVMCEFTTLTVMSYDRYVAICKPLDYHSVMTNSTLIILLLFSWLFPAFSMSTLLVLSNRLPLCGSHIDKLYCDNWSIVKLSCDPVTINNIYGLIIILIYFCLVIFIISSYCKLISACTKSIENKNKFMHTCLPHLLSLVNFTVALFFDSMDTRYGSKDFPQSLRNFMILEYLIIPPIFNPVIYGLKLTEVRKRALSVFIRVKVTDSSVKKR
ncbi:olfactory receptor 52E4-like [Megalops cyprinoides]|uniref:olfactory receptor 52E4-like n=1 Tax=Megalops cyprinoides TaxID=118141 RepID=UPI001864CAA3|nr:olfactory receptor 52E4-like [Megalops cyprinoides]